MLDPEGRATDKLLFRGRFTLSVYGAGSDGIERTEMILIWLLAVAFTASQAGASATKAAPHDRGPFAGLVTNDKFSRVRALFPQAKYARRENGDCLYTTDVSKPGCNTLEIRHFRFGNDDDYWVTFSFDGNDGLTLIRLSATDHSSSRALDRGERLQRLLRQYYGYENCHVAASCYYGWPGGAPFTSAHPTLAELRVYLQNLGDNLYSTSISIRPQSRR